MEEESNCFDTTLHDNSASLSSSLQNEPDHNRLQLYFDHQENNESDFPRVSHKTKSFGIAIDSSKIRAVPVAEQSAVLRDLKVDVFNQEEFEQGVLDQVDEAIAVKEAEELRKGWEKALAAVNEDIRSAEQEIKHDERILGGLESLVDSSSDAKRKAAAVTKHKENKLQQLKKLQATQKSLHRKLGLQNDTENDFQDAGDESLGESTRQEILKELESKKEQLIKSGQMTPFGSVISHHDDKAIFKEQNQNIDSDVEKSDSEIDCEPPLLTESHLRKKCEIAGELFASQKTVRFAGKPSFDDDCDDEYIPDNDEMKDSYLSDGQLSDSGGKETYRNSGEYSKRGKNKKRRLNVEYYSDDEEDKQAKKAKKKQSDKIDRKPMDDGNYKIYRERIRLLRIKELMRKRGEKHSEDSCDNGGLTDNELSDMEFSGGLKIPGQVWNRLYKYQQTGVKWLWELHCQQAGGIIGDEMGLGKTIQIIAFLAGLKYSKISVKKSRHSGLGAVLIVCPVTVLHQWVKEFHIWWPQFRVAVLHETGSYQGPKDKLINNICQEPGVLVMSYSGMRMHQESLLAQTWDYIILDEGHKIRNPDAEITLACKQFRTPHRIILSGSPMQNNFKELWSLFDFVFPGKLGTLPVFMTEFSVPITIGGYANASDVQVQTAYKCACVLRDTINPYLLRRLKKDVKMLLDLPNKNEQVLFCRLTDEQRQLYEEYLGSREVQSILSGNYRVFAGLIMLRKICNHPDLTSEAGSIVKAREDRLKVERKQVVGEDSDDLDDEGFGDWRRAGKMHVVEALLRMWKEQGNRVLLFSQSKQMLDILETFVQAQGYTYRRMDGGTAVASRHPLINKFNEDKSIFLFLLTTRVGGLGVNLVGADRVIIYDPDWNPSTDTQARERAWRIGQKKNVAIYRLLTTGTIEEKIYHRQIFKQFLTNRVLKDPKQRRFFKSNDLCELFTLDTSDKRGPSETSALFAGTGCEIKVPRASKSKRTKRKENRVSTKKVVFSERSQSSIRKQPRQGSIAVVEENEREKVDIEGTGGFLIDERDKKEIDCQLFSKLNTDESAKQETTSLPGEKNISGNEMSKDKKLVVLPEATGQEIVSNRLQPYEELQEKSNQSNKLVSDQQLNYRQPALNSCYYMTSGRTDNAVSGIKKKEKKQKLSLGKSSLKHKQIKKKRKRRDEEVEGRSIDFVAYKEQYQRSAVSGSGSSADERDKVDTSHQESFILKNLFKETGVHSALKHDVIMDSGDPDHTLVESEANRVAKQAAVALKRSRRRCLGAVSGIPTWTGVSGSSGSSDSPPIRKPRFGQRSTLKKKATEAKTPTDIETRPLFGGDVMGMSSANPEDENPVSSSRLLSKMRARNNMVALPSDTADESETQTSRNDELIVQIRNFIAFRCDIPGEASTQEVLNEFSSKLPSSNSAVFRSMLRQICDFTRNDDGEGMWRLKEEFR